MRHPDLKKMVEVFKGFPEIQVAYLFGSAAEGRVHSESDIDVAIFPGDDALRRKKLDMLSELANVGFSNIDLVFLHGNDIVLQYEAVRQNKVIYQRADFDSSSFYSIVVRKYLDFLPYLKVQREAYKKRILNGPA